MAITIKQVAEAMGKSQEFVRAGLRNNALPFGVAVPHKKRWSYYIYPDKFAEWFPNYSTNTGE